MHYSRSNVLRLALLTVIVIALAVPLAWLYRVIRVSLDAEHTYHAYSLVLEAVTMYLKSEKNWPKSWNDLVVVVPEMEHSFWRWLADVAEIQNRVRIDFTLSRSQVAEMTAETFTAIEPVSPHYGPRETLIKEVLQAARGER